MSRRPPSFGEVVAPERDIRTGRMVSSDRSGKDQQQSASHSQAMRAGRPRWLTPVMAGAAAVGAVLVVGGIAALASRGGGEDTVAPASIPSSESETDASTDPSAGATITSDDPAAVAPTASTGPAADENPIAGLYELTVTTTEGVSYLDGRVLGPDEGVGGAFPQEAVVECDGSACTLFTGGLVEATGDIVNGALHVVSRSPLGTADDGCAPQEQVNTVDLTISPDGSVTGTAIDDAEPAVVACGDNGRRGGARYVRVIEGQRVGPL